VSAGTHIKTELPLWGDFTRDLVAGSLQDGAFVFVEFEDASPTSLFRRRQGRKNSHWGTRVERGISQVTDWLFRISSEGPSDRVERDFGARHVIPMGVVVVGRRAEVTAYDRARLDWRSAHSVIGGAKLLVLTYDDLLAWLDGRITVLRT
jgi:antiviral defense system Shedu protein SduA